ncbi:MAG: hypothetical protein H6717_06420 [Polyangiaceae bacterium]|nr:hypothetical protein [Polyangiaceae bacterium]
MSYISNADAGSLATPTPFDGEWAHSTNVYDEIVANGWKPGLAKNTIYGAAIYLSRSKWEQSHAAVFKCVLNLDAGEVMSEFASESGTGDTQDHVLWHIREHGGIIVGRNASVGSSTQNQRITSYFSSRGIRAIHFREHGTPVVAVYDPSCLLVLK